MCLIIGLVFLVAGYLFLLDGLMTQSLISFIIGGMIIVFFTVRMYKYRYCMFGKNRDCNQNNMIDINKK
jgi:glucan phosphoethanolaminetransferase (alkaline phosphatase superfamily)